MRPTLLLAVDTQRVRRRGSRRMVRHLHPPVAPRRARGRREARYHLSALGVLRDGGELPEPTLPPLLTTALENLSTGGLTLSRFVDSNAGYPTCDPPRSAKVGAMPVSPAAADTGLVLSLHWLVVSFFALSFAFQFAAAVFDLTRRSRRRRHRRVLIGDTSEEVARADDTRDAGVHESVVSFLLLPYGQLE